MTKQKKSFLDKIINSDADLDENKEIKIEDNSVSDNSKIAEKEDELINNENEEKGVEDVIKEDVEKEKQGVNKDNGWMNGGEKSSDEEGQLTVDVYKTKNLVVVRSIIGGVRPEDLDISVTSDMVTIKGMRNNPDEVKKEDYYYQECFWGNFSRSIILPCDIKSEEVEATIKNGILTIKLPKIEKNSLKKIEVKEE